MKSSLDSLEKKKGHLMWNGMEHLQREPNSGQKDVHLVRWRGFSLPITPPGVCIRHMALSPKVTEISRGKACAKGMDLRMKRWGGLLSQMVEDTHHRLLPSTSLQQSSEPREHRSQPPPHHHPPLNPVGWARRSLNECSLLNSVALL